jgi:hypothetical protein
MKFSINSTPKTIRKALADTANELTIEELIDWKAETWSHLIAITAGLKPFTGAATLIIPEVFRAFLPRVEFDPTLQDRQLAATILKTALFHVNRAIIETTKAAYGNVLTSPIGGLLNTLKSSIPGGIDQFLVGLEQELSTYEMRKLYFQTGLAMMTEEQAWQGKHQTFAVGVINIYEADPNRILTDDEFFAFAYDLGILRDGKVTFNPLSKDNNKALSPDEMMSALNQTLNQAYDSGNQ